MTMEMKLEEQYEAGLMKGREQGLEQGLERGLEQGIKVLLFDVHMTIPEIAEKLSIPEERVQSIAAKLGKNL